MAPRSELRPLFNGLGIENIYFQPPTTLEIKYPCIVYKIDDLVTKAANNRPYSLKTRYQLTLIHANPDNDIKEKLAMLPLCEFDRSYSADKHMHYIFNLYF